MTLPDPRALWTLAHALRDRGTRVDTATLATEAISRGIAVDLSALRAISRKSRSYDFALTPDDAVIQVFSSIASAKKPKVVLDPWAGMGHVIDAVISAAHPARAIAMTINDQEGGIGKALVTKAEWVIADPLESLEKVGQVDLIVSCPPFGYRREPREVTVGGATIRDDYGNLLVAKACVEHLSQNGIGVFVLPPRFLFSDTPLGLRKSMESLGLSLSAAIHIPSGYWHGTNIETYLIVFDREPHSDIFVAEISQSEEHNDLIVHNMFARRRGADVASGTLTDKAFSNYHELEASERAQRMAQRMGVRAVAMTEVALEINLTKKPDASAFLDKDNAVYVPLIGTSRVYTSKDDLSLKAHNYAQIVLDPLKALAPYVAGYFNSPIGRATLDGLRTGATIPHVTKGALNDSVLYLPEIDIQTICIQAESNAINLISELSALRSQIWESPKNIKRVLTRLAKVNHEESLLTWMDALPFPLSSVLWTYHASGAHDKDAYQHLLHFFEAFGEFYAIVLWSAIQASESLRRHSRYPLGPDKPFKNSIEKSSFGTWVELVSRLSKFGRSLLNGTNEDKESLITAFGIRDTDVFESIFSSDIIGQLQEANALRNRTTGHGGIVGTEESQRRRVVLENMLAALRANVGDVWLRFPLLKAGPARIKSGLYTYDAELIMGRSSPFQRLNVVTRNQIDDGTLFLFAEDTGVGVPLEPLLLVGPSPDQAQNACYFYNRLEGDQLRFVSYHFEKEAEIRSADSNVSAALRSIMDSIGGT